jgi:voltage-gated sodium channel
VESLVFIYFGLEIILHYIGTNKDFMKNNWNIFNLIIWIAELISWFTLNYETSHIFGVFRIVRFLTPLKSRNYDRYLVGVRSIIDTITGSIRDVASIGAIVLFFTYFWANVGYLVFGEKVPLDFGTLRNAFFTMFVAVTQIGWVDTFSELEKQGLTTEAVVFYVTYFLIVVFVIAKIIVAVVVSNLEDFHKHLGETERAKNKKLRSTKAALAGTGN